MHELLLLDDLASPRGDGLHPLLRALFEARAMREAQGVVDLNSRAPDGLQRAGPPPSGRLPDFLPGNVVPMSAYSKQAAAAARASQKKY